LTDYPPPIVAVNRVAPVPRRMRAPLTGETVLDTISAQDAWEWPHATVGPDRGVSSFIAPRSGARRYR
jgi:hypothetical protein